MKRLHNNRINRPPGKPPKWDKNKQYFPPVDNSIDKVDTNSEKVIDVLIQKLDSIQTECLIKKNNISMNFQSNLIYLSVIHYEIE